MESMFLLLLLVLVVAVIVIVAFVIIDRIGLDATLAMLAKTIVAIIGLAVIVLKGLLPLF